MASPLRAAGTLAALTLSAWLGAQPACTPCLGVNWTRSTASIMSGRSAYALQITPRSTQRRICRVDFFVRTRFSLPIRYPVRLRAMRADNRPGAVLRESTLVVGPAFAVHSATLVPPVVIAPGQAFFVTLDTRHAQVFLPIAPNGAGVVVYHGGPTVWHGPTNDVPWSFQLHCATRGARGAAIRRFGAGCRGSAGVPEHITLGAAGIGGALRPNVIRAPAFAPAALVLFPVRAPFDLGRFGAPGCRLEVPPQFVVAARPTNGPGRAEIFLRVPANPWLVGRRLHAQWTVVDRRANALGVTVSDAATWTFGDY